MSSLNLFRLGLRGVNVVTAATHLTDDEMLSAQNAEYISVLGQGAIDQRPGMTRINASALGSIVAIHNVLPRNVYDLTPTLYAGMNTAAAHTWRKSTDGTTWTNVDTPAKPFAANASITGFFKNFPKVVTIGAKMYFVDGSAPIQVHEWNGTTDRVAGTIPSAVSGSTLNTPAAPSVTANTENPTGATTYSYKIVAKQGSVNNSAASAAGTTTVGPAALGSLNYNSVNPGTPGAGVTSADVYRTAGGATQGKIGNIPVVAGAYTTGNGSGLTGTAGPLLDRPTMTSVTPETETVGATTYTYVLVAVTGADHSIGSITYTTAVGPAALSASNYNALLFNTVSPVTGSATYDVYRSVGGATQGKIGTITITSGAFSRGNGSGATGTPFPTISPMTLTAIQNGLATTYTYKIVAINNANHSAAGGAFTTAIGPTALDATHTITVGLALGQAFPASGQGFDVYRTVGGTTQGRIISGLLANGFVDNGLVGNGVAAPASVSGLDAGYPDGIGNPVFSDAGLVGDGAIAPTTGTGLKAGSANIFSDGGLVGDAAVAPVTATGTTAGNALGVIDMITDGSSLLLAVIDQDNNDPIVYGRILQFFPTTNTWGQIGLSFPLTAGSGGPSALVYYDGALSFGTFTGIASGNTSYMTGTQNPLPAGGITEIHTTAASLATCCMAVFQGVLYVGMVSLVAATAAMIVKRVVGATWSTARTGPATAQFNAYTSMAVFNGMLFAGWTSGDGGTAARIESTLDGVTWTNEVTLDAAEVVCQMVGFNGLLYAVLGKTGIAYNTKTRIMQRSSIGAWTAVDDPSDDFAGCLGVVYV